MSTDSHSNARFYLEDVISSIQAKANSEVKTNEEVVPPMSMKPPKVSTPKTRASKRKSSEVEIVKVVEGTLDTSAKHKKFKELVKQVVDLGGALGEEALAADQAVKAVELSVTMEKLGADVAEDEVKKLKNELDFCREKMEAERKEVAALQEKISKMEADFLDEMTAAKNKCINDAAKTYLQCRVMMMEQHAVGDYSSWKLEEGRKMLLKYLKGKPDPGEVSSQVHLDSAREGVSGEGKQGA